MQIEENPNLHRLKRDVEYLCAFSGTRIHEKSTRKVEEMALYIFFYNKGRGVPLPYPPRPTKGGGHPSLTNPDPIHAAPATRLEILVASFIPIFFIYFIKGRGTPLPYPPRSNPYSPATRLQTAQLTS